MNGPILTSKPVGMGEIIDVVAHAMEVFGDRRTALRWFRTADPRFR